MLRRLLALDCELSLELLAAEVLLLLGAPGGKVGGDDEIGENGEGREAEVGAG